MSVVLAQFDPVTDRAAWLRWRREGIGGSDIAALLGWSRFDSPTSIYLDKLGMLDDTDAGEAARWGRLLEHAIGAEFEEREGLYLGATQVCAASTDPAWQRCTLDGLVLDNPSPGRLTTAELLDRAVGIAEFKNSSSFGWDDIPDEYQVQCQWNMGITGQLMSWLAVLHAGRRFQVHPIAFDPAAFEGLTRVGREFWTDRVLAHDPPPVDSASATTDALKNAYRERADGEFVELDDDARDAALRWAAAKARVKDAQAELDLIENTLRVSLGDASFGTIAGVDAVSWKPQATAAQLDREAMKADGVYEKYLGVQGTTRVLRATKKLKEMH